MLPLAPVAKKVANVGSPISKRDNIRLNRSYPQRAAKEFRSKDMDRLGVILGTVVFFLFPVPFLLDFAVSRDGDWSAWLAYVAVAVLVSGAVAAAIAAKRRGG